MPCPHCDDTGWKATEVDGIRRVTRCDCWRDQAGDRRLSEARIPKRYQHCDLANFNDHNDSLINAVRRAGRLAEAFPVVERGLFLLGPPGVGKTHLAVAVLKQVIRTRGARGVFYDTRDLLRVIRSTYDPVVQMTELEVLRPVMDADLLVLDDLGAEKTSEWVEETLNLIVNTRYNERRTTIFTSNYEDKSDAGDPDSLLVRIGFRMRSRLHEMCEFVDMNGIDYRELPSNYTEEDIVRLDQRGRPVRRPDAARSRQLKAQLREGKADLNWSGGRAGR